VQFAHEQVLEMQDLSDLMKELGKMFKLQIEKQKKLKQDIDDHEQLNEGIKQALTPAQACLVSKDFLIEKCIRLEYILQKLHTTLQPLTPSGSNLDSEQKQLKV